MSSWPDEADAEIASEQHQCLERKDDDRGLRQTCRKQRDEGHREKGRVNDLEFHRYQIPA